MGIELMVASAAITLALFCYTAGVFSERRRGTLTGGGLALFWAGLAFDTTGTTIMTLMARSSQVEGFGIHGVTGALAIVLMLIHAVWATITYLRRNERGAAAFHRFSTAVWLLWLVPYIIGMLVGIPVIGLLPVCAVGTSIVVVALIALAMRLWGKRGHAAH